MSTIIRRERRSRGFFGWLFLLLFIVFNLAMAAWMLWYWQTVAPMVGTGSEAARTGAAIGTVFGTTFRLFFWVAGAVILGLFALLTRGRKVIIEETRVDPF